MCEEQAYEFNIAILFSENSEEIANKNTKISCWTIDIISYSGWCTKIIVALILLISRSLWMS